MFSLYYFSIFLTQNAEKYEILLRPGDTDDNVDISVGLRCWQIWFSFIANTLSNNNNYTRKYCITNYSLRPQLTDIYTTKCKIRLLDEYRVSVYVWIILCIDIASKSTLKFLESPYHGR